MIVGTGGPLVFCPNGMTLHRALRLGTMACLWFTLSACSEAAVSPHLVPCNDDSACVALDDGDRCNGTFECTAGSCRYTATQIACGASKDSACLAAQCVPSTGECALKPRKNGVPCDDGLLCT